MNFNHLFSTHHTRTNTLATSYWFERFFT